MRLIDDVLLELVWLVHAWFDWNLLHRLLAHSVVIDVLIRIDLNIVIIVPLYGVS